MANKVCVKSGVPVGDSVKLCYLRNHQLRFRAILAECTTLLADKDIKSYTTVVSGGHQCRIPGIRKSAVATALLANIDTLRSIRNFDTLVDAVSELMHDCGVKSVPSLWTYDIALRVGQSCEPKVEPQNYVYAFRGANTGAQYLLSSNKIPNKIAARVFDETLGDLDPMDIENLLCICKECIKHGGPTPNKHCN